jgi:hypothetical protein
MILTIFNLGDLAHKIDILTTIIQKLTILNRDHIAITMIIKIQLKSRTLNLEDLLIFHQTKPY